MSKSTEQVKAIGGIRFDWVVIGASAWLAAGLIIDGWAHNHGVPEIAVPRRMVFAGDIPVLGTGKTDYVRVQKMAETEAGAAA